MFQGTEEVSIQPALMQSRLQWATRCSLVKAMTALHTRLLNTNDLLALEQGYVERSAGLFEPSARPVTFDRTLERYRAVHALLDDQNTLLAAGHNDWMRQATLQLGPGYQEMLTRIQHTRLFGPEVVQQLQNQSGAAFAEFRRQFEQAFGSRGQPGIVWLENEKRFGLSSERAALLQGLGALLKTSFMADDAPHGTAGASANAKAKVQDTGTLAKAVEDAKALADERTRASTDIVPLFPERARPVVARVVDARVSELIYQRAYRALKAALPTDASIPLEPVAFRRQRDQVLALQGILKETGGSALGDRLVATLDGEVLRRLTPLQEELEQQPLEGPHAMQFPWWQGDPLPLAQLLGAADTPTAPPSFAHTVQLVDMLARQAKALIALGSPKLADDPAAVRWTKLQAEVARYDAHAPDSSLARLERYVAALGPDFSRQNCAERLSANLPPTTADDEFAQRHIQLHNGLSLRCNELRSQATVPAPILPQ
jgi:type VI secretion system protein ImpL